MENKQEYQDPLSFVDLFLAAYVIMRRRRGMLTAIALVLLVPVSILLSAVIDLPSPPDFDPEVVSFTDWVGGEELAQWVRDIAPSLAFQFLVSSLVSVVVAGAVFRMVTSIYAGYPEGWQTLVAASFARLGPILLTLIITLVAVAMGLFLFIIPGLFLMIAWVLWPGAVVVENLRPVQALRRSWRLVRSRWWPVCGTLAVAVVLVVGVGTMLTAIPAAFIPSEGFLIIWSSLVNAFVEMFFLVVVALLYIELRLRKEGLDQEQLSLELRVTAPDH